MRAHLNRKVIFVFFYFCLHDVKEEFDSDLIAFCTFAEKFYYFDGAEYMYCRRVEYHTKQT